MTKRLMLSKVKKIHFKDKETGEPVETFKYYFKTPDNKWLIAYGELGVFQNDVTGTIDFDDTKANDYEFDLRDFGGKVKEKLIETTSKGGEN